MIWTIVAIVFAGLGAAGVALILRKLSRNKLPKWIIPVFGGLGMLGYQISYEYSWFEHQQQRQPEGAVVVSTETGQVFWRPWTYHFPMIIAFSVVDTRNLVTTQLDDGAQVVEFILYRFEKQHVDLVTHQAYLLNCASTEMLPLNDQRQPQLQRLSRLDRDDVLYQTVCQD
ncbi:MAG: hypothetical protein ACK4L8_15490 [Nitrincola lacisaponensis]|uniref:Uncharacterized protein n=1 Tax=Nitrincola lacisaponensis TaxID=267850 RepID=A0A063Y380_9GAMM|nr:hypothetical protein [Nitrincola lacisaponensis]KDE39610.1 hypothetical protein ADINL_1888 [Nitrincola lacisaponensis]